MYRQWGESPWQVRRGSHDDFRAAVTTSYAGDIRAAPFGGFKSGLLQHFTWGGWKVQAAHDLIAGNCY